MEVYLVISIAMLDPAPKESDPYQRPREHGQKPVADNGDPDQKQYESEKPW